MFLSDQVLSEFGEALAGRERSAATVEKYLREVSGLAAWLGERPLSRETLLAYREELARRRTPAGVNGAVSAVNGLLNFLGRPAWRLRAARVQRRLFREESRELTAAEYRRLLAAAQGRGNRRLLLVMETICATGIRVGELGQITVEAAAQGRAEVCNKGKTREVLLPTKLCKLLRTYARERGLTAGPVFVTRTGRPLDRSNIWAEMKGLCREARVAEGKVFPHNLRHLFARTFYKMERDIVRLADILGHSSVDTTRIYTAESGRSFRRRLDRLGLLLE